MFVPPTLKFRDCRHVPPCWCMWCWEWSQRFMHTREMLSQFESVRSTCGHTRVGTQSVWSTCGHTRVGRPDDYLQCHSSGALHLLLAKQVTQADQHCLHLPLLRLHTNVVCMCTCVHKCIYKSICAGKRKTAGSQLSASTVYWRNWIPVVWLAWQMLTCLQAHTHVCALAWILRVEMC